MKVKIYVILVKDGCEFALKGKDKKLEDIIDAQFPKKRCGCLD